MSEDTAVRAERDGSAEAAPVSLSIPARVARALVLAAVFTCAACGLVYELALVALGSYLMGNSVTQASIVLSVMVFAMVGSLLAKPLRRWPVAAFAVVEAALAVVGGLSVLALYAAFAWLSLYNPVLIVVAFLVGALIGAELPLLMTLLQRIRRQEAGAAVADLFAADYVGALIGGLAFPFLLLPLFGHIRGALLVGAVNVVAGMAVVLWLFRRELGRGVQAALWSTMAAVLLARRTYALADRFEVSARQVLYRDPIAVAADPYQRSSSPGRSLGRPDMRLFLNGDSGSSWTSTGPRVARPPDHVRPPRQGADPRRRDTRAADVLRRRAERDARRAGPGGAAPGPHLRPLASLNERAFEDPRVRPSRPTRSRGCAA